MADEAEVVDTEIENTEDTETEDGETVTDKVISMLTTMYSNQAMFDAEKIEIIVGKVVEEVIAARGYAREGYSDDQIQEDLLNYKSQIYNLAEYDFAHFGAPWESNRSENSTNRTWIDRNKLFAGIVSLAHF